MDRKEIAEVLNNISILLELKGENPFKVRAFQNASQLMSNTTEDIEELVESKKLTTLKGVGKSIAEIITELVIKGKAKEYEDLKAEFPKELIELIKIQGLGPKRIKIIYEKLGIKTITQLKEACEKQKLRNIDGLGAKTEENILKSIEYFEKSRNKHLYPEALQDAEKIKEILCYVKGIKQCSETGSLRRKKELIGDIDIVVSCPDDLRAKVTSKFTSNELVESVVASGATKTSVMLRSGIQCDLRIVKDSEYPFALNYFTGSKEHNIQLRSVAKKYGWSLNEYGFSYIGDKDSKNKAKEIPVCKSEEDIYRALGLNYIPPELRENMGEIEFAEKHQVPKLVEYEDIRGTLHCHSNYSDGFSTMQQMTESAIKLGWEYLGIADHSQSAAYAGGMNVDEVKKQIREIDDLNEKQKKFHILKGIECDILSDGSLDFPDHVLSCFDYVVVSIHSKFNMTESEATKRIIKALKNKYTTMLGHPTGRLLLEREGYPVNMREIIDAASDYGKSIELNCHPKRFDIDWRFIRYAKEKKVVIFINPDAHSIEGLNDVKFGVGIARKGWLEPDDVGNTWSYQNLMKYFNDIKVR